MPESAPQALPPNTGTQESGGTAPSKPNNLSASELAQLAGTATAAGGGGPTRNPPQGATAGGVTTTWQSDKRVGALWAKNENRNSWVLINAIGWKKLANNSDSAIVALSILSGSAKQTQTRVDYREEADGMIHEMYVW